MTSGEDTRRRWSVPAAALPSGAIVVLALIYAPVLAFGWGGDAAREWLSACAAAVSAGSLFFAAQRSSSKQPDTTSASTTALSNGAAAAAGAGGGVSGKTAQWRCFGIAALAWCVGAVVSALSQNPPNRSADVSIVDLLLVTALVALAAGFIVPISMPRKTRVWLRYAADTYVCVCALFIVGWVAAFHQLYHSSGDTGGQFFLELRYPLADAVLICAMLPMVLGTVRGLRRSALVGYAALIVITASDIVAMVIRLRGGTIHENPADLIGFVGLLVLGIAPWVRRRTAEKGGGGGSNALRGRIQDGAGEGEPERGHLVGPGIAPSAAAAAAAIFVAGHSLTDGRTLEPIVAVVAGSAVLVLLIRLGELVRDNDRLRKAVTTGEEHFRALAESINDVVLICRLDGVVQYVSAGAQRTYSYQNDELLGRPLLEIIHPEDLPRVEEALAEFQKGEGVGPALRGWIPHEDTAAPADVVRVACRVRAADGTWLPTESTISRYAHAEHDGPDRLLVTTRDFSEQAALRRQVTHLTFHDGLTGLPNRSYFEERAREVVARRQGMTAVIFTDLDGFTAVNDSIGHAGGDQVLAQAARRLRAGVQADDTVARWGGDEFAVLVENVGEVQAVVDLGERLLRALATEPYRVGDRSIVLTGSIGIAFAEEGTRGAELIRNADVALSRAKELGGSRVEVFAAHMHADVVRRLELSSDLQRALAEHEFAVEFQPVVELATSRVTGVEALVRWWRGSVFVPPEEFIGPAEESGLMVPLGNWVLREACQQVARWRESDWEIGLSVNLRPREIAAPRFVESVAAALDESGLPPHALTLEVQEEVLVEDAGGGGGGPRAVRGRIPNQIIERLSALRDLGVRLAIDDFGTGYASLAYLRQLPVDIIKIDPSFVAGLGRDETLTLLTRTIVRLGHDLGLIVVAEGIERPEQLELLREMGCPRGQGFLVARPMAAGRIESLVRTSLRGDTAIPLQGSAISAG